MTTPRAVATEVDQILTHLFERGVLHYWNSVRESATRISWESAQPFEDFLKERDRSTIDGYLHWLRNGMYSGLLTDGSLLQVTYDFDGSDIVGHRLAYVPCPVAVDQELLAEGYEMAEVVELQLGAPGEVLMRSVVRFDYDPTVASPDHPASHFTINGVECRIACATPVRLGRFIDFVFRNFYPNVYADDPVLQRMPQKGWFKRNKIVEDTDLLHLNWSA